MEGLSSDAYETYISNLRETEYPNLKGTVYLDHAGTTPYAKSLIKRFSHDLTTNLYGNPHSASASSQLSTQKIDDIRLKALGLFNADPNDFDLIFVANATAGVKLVAEALQCHENGFSYFYHRDCHTSLVGLRELATGGHTCLVSDRDVESWLDQPTSTNSTTLFAYPAQSNLNGRRLPLQWAGKVRRSDADVSNLCLLDAAGLVSTTSLDLGDAARAPDFTVVSFYKIFGFPDLGALIVRKSVGHVMRRRKYFGGGTVDMVLCQKEAWHVSKSDTLHDALEDGTLPVHNILALGIAIDVHRDLFGPFDRISTHTSLLARHLFEGLDSLRHGNGKKVCVIYASEAVSYDDSAKQGPIIAFNIRNSRGAWISNAEVEKLTTIKGIHLRTGGVCNPGGIADALALAPWEMRANFSAGQRCGGENDIFEGKPTGVIRLSLGAMSTKEDVQLFLEFMTEFYVDSTPTLEPGISTILSLPDTSADFFVESLMVYPIKSCAGWKIVPGQRWSVRKEGLAWDREWCLVHSGTGRALSQKRYPRMALIRPQIDLERGVLRIRYEDTQAGEAPSEIRVSLSADPSYFSDDECESRVCDDVIQGKTYRSEDINSFFSRVLGVSCRLVRFPAGGTAARARHAKADMPTYQPLLLSNESPILTISRSSLNRLNEQIKAAGGKAAQAEAFRANIVVAPDWHSQPGSEQPYAEDEWAGMQIGEQYYEMLGPCRRCHMVCVDQHTAERNENPFVTLAKTRRVAGKVFFGQHTRHVGGTAATPPGGSHLLASTTTMIPSVQHATIGVGDKVRPVLRHEMAP